MAGKIKMKRGGGAAVNAYTGPYGELVFNRDTKSIHIQDGSTQGGHSITAGGSVDAPNIASPANNSSFSTMPNSTLSGLTYSGSFNHSATQWQLASDNAFNDVVYDSGFDESNKTSIDFNTVPKAWAVQRYYIRARALGDNLQVSQWAAPVSFNYTGS
jgi:hypothetical protein